MSTNEWALIVQIISSLISFFVLVAVIVSLRQVNRSLKSNAIAGIYSEIHEIHRVFIEHPDLRPYFFHNKIMSSEDEKYFRARGIAEMFFDIFEHIYQLKNSADQETKKNFESYIKHMCESSRFLCEYLDENIELVFPLELRSIIRREIDKNKAG